MRVTPRTDAEIEFMGLMPEGIYKFEVLDAIDKISKSGNEMIEIHLKVWDKDGHVRIVFDYLLDAMAYKIKHFVTTTNLVEKYESGELLANDCLGKKGSVEIIIQPGNPNPNGGNYPSKNAVKDYVATLDVKPSSLQPIKKDDFFNDEIPF